MRYRYTTGRLYGFFLIKESKKKKKKRRRNINDSKNKEQKNRFFGKEKDSDFVDSREVPFGRLYFFSSHRGRLD